MGDQQKSARKVQLQQTREALLRLAARAGLDEAALHNMNEVMREEEKPQ